MEHYYQKPPDYNQETLENKEVLLEDLSECKFSYWDGSAWQAVWSKERGEFPRMIKVNFKFSDETKEKEFIVNIPVSS